MKCTRKEANRIIRFSKKIILALLVSVALFTVVCLVVFCACGSVPDTLIIEFFGFFKLEGGALSIIKVAETIMDNFHKSKNKKECGGSEDESE